MKKLLLLVAFLVATSNTLVMAENVQMPKTVKSSEVVKVKNTAKKKPVKKKSAKKRAKRKNVDCRGLTETDCLLKKGVYKECSMFGCR